MSPVKTAVLLCAGRGNRLRPHTDTTPKPLLVHDGLPTLEYSLRSLLQAGIERVCFVTHYLAEQIESYAESQVAPHFAEVECVRQPRIAGTADALECVIDVLPHWLDHGFVLAATDYIVPEHFYPDLLQYHVEKNAAVSVSLKHLPGEQLLGRSSVRFDDDRDILEIVEKPEPGTAPSQYSANLVFVLPAGIVTHVRQVESSARGEREIQTAVNRYIDQHQPAAGLVQAAPMEWEPPA